MSNSDPVLTAGRLRTEGRASCESTLHLDLGPPESVDSRCDFTWAFSGWAQRSGACLRAVTLSIGRAEFSAAPIIRFEAAPPDPEAPPRLLVCGFAGLAVLPAGTPAARLEAVLCLEWSDGAREFRPLGPIEVTQSSPERTPGRAGRLVAVCMATYNPDPALFRAQIDSLIAQTHTDWICLIQDDGSSEERWREILAITAGDARFHCARNATNLGFYRNFERSLSRVPPEAAFVALADQDDSWHPGKLAALIPPLEAGAMLAFCDMRVVDRRGAVLSDVFWPGRQGRYNQTGALLMANVVTGCACLFRAELLERALPFPRVGRHAYHDHWIACCAAGAGIIAYVPQPLSDYVQHGGNTLGYRRAGGRLIAKAAAALLLAPLVAVAARVCAVRRRWPRVLNLLVDCAQQEYLVRVVFAETLRRRGLLPGGPEDFPADFPLARGARRFLIRAGLVPGRQGIAYRATALRLLAGLEVERRLSALLGKPPSGPA